MQAKVEEKKELLEHYEDKSYLYGRRVQDPQSHTHALIRNYEQWKSLSAAPILLPDRWQAQKEPRLYNGERA